ncbi:MAG: hypothetical protein ACYCXZ_03075 [Coriobacteriia bacterium]
MLHTFLSTLIGKLVLGTAAVAVAASTSAAATGNLPDPAQQAVSDALGRAGIEVPAPSDEDVTETPDERTAPVLPDEASDTAKAVTGAVFDGDPKDGRSFGQSVAGAASEATPSAGSPKKPEVREVPQKPERPALPEQAGDAPRP